MKLTAQQKKANREEFKKLSPAGKADYIFEYYKLPIFMTVLALVIIISAIVRTATKKEDALYLGALNVSFGSETEAALTEDFLNYAGMNPKRQQVYLYTGLYIAEDPDQLNHEYAYASRMKLMAAVNAGKMDVVLMNREGYDILSASGYLLDLSELVRPEYGDRLVNNQVVLEDNEIDYLLNEADSHETVTESAANGLSLSGTALASSAGFDDEVYLGVIANSSRRDVAGEYIEYLLNG